MATNPNTNPIGGTDIGAADSGLAIDPQIADPYYSEHTGKTIDDAVRDSKGIMARVQTQLDAQNQKVENDLAQQDQKVDEKLNDLGLEIYGGINDNFVDEETNVTSEYVFERYQSYGSVGGKVNFDSASFNEATLNWRHTYINKDDNVVRVVSTTPSGITSASSILQFVDANGNITRRLGENIGNNETLSTEISFNGNEVGFYISGDNGKIQIFAIKRIEGDGSLKEGLIEKVEKNISNINKISNEIYGGKDNIVDVETDVTNDYTFDEYQSYGNVGGKVIFDKNGFFPDHAINWRHTYVKKEDGVVKITSTTPSGITSASSILQFVDANGNITRRLGENIGNNETLSTEISFNGNEVGFYISGDYGKIKIFAIKRIEGDGGILVKIKQIEELLKKQSDNVQDVSKSSYSKGGLFSLNDFGLMPSCLYNDDSAFLKDGVNSDGSAKVKYADVIAKYDRLVELYPNYVTKTLHGNDASGTIPMYSYSFTPKYYKQHVYLQAGVHGWEPDPVFALAQIMYLIANSYGGEATPTNTTNEVLKYLRGNVKFTIFPCVNPYGFNRRADCGIDKRNVAQNNYHGVQLNGQWNGNEAECVYVRNLIDSIASELSFAIDMHSTVWTTTRDKYGCFYGIVNKNAKNVRTIFRTYQWLYEFYDVKYPSIVRGDSVPNVIGNYASLGYLSAGVFSEWIYNRHNIQASTLEFSDHVWTPDLHTSEALSVAVNMYLNVIMQQVNDKYKEIEAVDIPESDYYQTIG